MPSRASKTLCAWGAGCMLEPNKKIELSVLPQALWSGRKISTGVFCGFSPTAWAPTAGSWEASRRAGWTEVLCRPESSVRAWVPSLTLRVLPPLRIEVKPHPESCMLPVWGLQLWPSWPRGSSSCTRGAKRKPVADGGPRNQAKSAPAGRLWAHLCHPRQAGAWSRSWLDRMFPERYTFHDWYVSPVLPHGIPKQNVINLKTDSSFPPPPSSESDLV